MCGICGVAGWENHIDDRRVFDDLLVISSLRGLDSTGIAAISPIRDKGEVVDSNWEVLKTVGNPYDLRAYKDYEKLAHSWESKVVIGHCRAATFGSKTKENAHPFQFDHVVGVHNGTIHSGLVDREKFGTDSEALYSRIDRDGVRAAIEDLPTHQGAAYALVWFDDRTMTLNFLRNTFRPLYFTSLKERNTLFWASEPGMLLTALNRHGLKYHEIGAVPPNKHFQLHPFEGKNWLEKFEVSDLNALDKGRQVYRPPFRQQGGSAYGGAAAWEDWPQDAEAWEAATEVGKLVETGNRMAQAKSDEERLEASKHLRQQRRRANQRQQREAEEKRRIAEEESERLLNLFRERNGLPAEQNHSTSQKATTSTTSENQSQASSTSIGTGEGSTDGNEPYPDCRLVEVPPFREETKKHNWFGTKITATQYKERLDVGCFGCGKQSNFGSVHRHISPMAYLCKDCSELGQEYVADQVEMANSPIYSTVETKWVN